MRETIEAIPVFRPAELAASAAIEDLTDCAKRLNLLADTAFPNLSERELRTLTENAVVLSSSVDDLARQLSGVAAA
ncbi:MAG TPA: hypothetical protein VE999_23220 [Gemmataceae bacterium]|nr:hypothetical protein [Gemmataceae bacterium]